MNKIEYYEDMLEQEAINKYLNMIANDYNGELAKIFQEKYINKDKEIERLNNIINEFERLLQQDLENEKDTYWTNITKEDYIQFTFNKLQELKGSDEISK